MLYILSSFLYDGFPLGDVSSLVQPPIHSVVVGVIPCHLGLESSCAVSAVDLDFEWLTFEPPFPLLVPHMILSPENSVHLWICLVVPACTSHHTRWKEAKSQMRMSYCDVVRSVCICCVHLLGCSVVSDSLRPPWTVAHQALLSMEFSRQETFVKWMNLYKSKTVIWTFILCI